MSLSLVFSWHAKLLGKFIPNLPTLVHSLNKLLKTGQPWRWTKEHATVFQPAKLQLSYAPVLMHYNPKLSICLAEDASSYGIGTVLSQVLPNGTPKWLHLAQLSLEIAANREECAITCFLSFHLREACVWSWLMPIWSGLKWCLWTQPSLCRLLQCCVNCYVHMEFRYRQSLTMDHSSYLLSWSHFVKLIGSSTLECHLTLGTWAIAIQ